MKAFTPVLLIFLLLLIHTDVHSQKIIINGKETNRKLTWPDFTGIPDNNSSLYAYTYYNISYRYKSVSFIGDSAVVEGIEVTLQLDPQKSWAKREQVTDELLVHEQGHFNLGILCMKEMLAIYKKAAFRKNGYDAAIQDVFLQTMAKYNMLTTQYDEETRHFLDKDQQLKWNQFFADQLR